jgi:hypothetical protein
MHLYELWGTLTKKIRYIEENHAYKLESHARQNQRSAPPGMPSQEMMSFWGKYSNLDPKLDLKNMPFKGINSDRK